MSEPEAGRLTVRYQEADLDKVMSYFAKDFEGDVMHAEWFVDTAKGRVVFKLYVAVEGSPSDR